MGIKNLILAGLPEWRRLNNDDKIIDKIEKLLKKDKISESELLELAMLFEKINLTRKNNANCR